MARQLRSRILELLAGEPRDFPALNNSLPGPTDKIQKTLNRLRDAGKIELRGFPALYHLVRDGAAPAADGPAGITRALLDAEIARRAEILNHLQQLRTALFGADAE